MIRSIPEKLGEVWQLDIRPVVADRRKCWCLLIVSPTTDSLLPDRLIIAYDLLAQRPTSTTVAGYIRRAILAPRRGTPCRPSYILQSHEVDSPALQDYIRSLGVRVACRDPYSCWQRTYEILVAKLEHLSMPTSSLRTSPGMEDETLVEFFEAANTFLRLLGEKRINVWEEVAGPKWSVEIENGDSPTVHLIEHPPERHFSSLVDMLRHSVTLGVRSDGNRWWSPDTIAELKEHGVKLEDPEKVPYPYRSNPGGTCRLPLASELKQIKRTLAITVSRQARFK